jgi:hypothetical protein
MAGRSVPGCAPGCPAAGDAQVARARGRAWAWARMREAECWACRHWADRRASVPAVYCWHTLQGRYVLPLCAECAARWKSFGDPGRLHTLSLDGCQIQS